MFSPHKNSNYVKLISMIVVITSLCIHISKYHTVYLKYVPSLFVDYTSTKLEKIKSNARTSGKGTEEVKDCYQNVFPDQEE